MKDFKALLDHSYNWTSRTREVNNIVYIEKYKSNLEEIIETKQYVVKTIIEWNYSCKDTSLLPEISQLGLVYQVENDLLEIFEKDMQSVLYYACLGNGKKEWRFYSIDIGETLKRLEAVLEGQPSYADFSFSTEKDIEWKDYKEVNRLERY